MPSVYFIYICNVEFLNFSFMNEKEYLKAFVMSFPEYYRDRDIKNFVQYAVKDIKNKHSFDGEYMSKHNIPEAIIEEYRFAFDCIKVAMEL